MYGETLGCCRNRQQSYFKWYLPRNGSLKKFHETDHVYTVQRLLKLVSQRLAHEHSPLLRFPLSCIKPGCHIVVSVVPVVRLGWPYENTHAIIQNDPYDSSDTVTSMELRSISTRYVIWVISGSFHSVVEIERNSIRTTVSLLSYGSFWIIASTWVIGVQGGWWWPYCPNKLHNARKCKLYICTRIAVKTKTFPILTSKETIIIPIFGTSKGNENCF